MGRPEFGDLRHVYFRPMPILSVLTLISLAILIMLGNWQYERYTGKMQARNAPVSDIADRQVEVVVDATNAGKAQLVYGTLDGEPVWRRYVPGRIAGDGRLVLVVWDATGGPTPVALAISEVDADFTRTGRLVPTDVSRGRFAPRDNPSENQWYTLDPPAMAANLGYSEAPAGVVETELITVRNSENLSQARQTRNTYVSQDAADPLPPERHIGYALTWWGMAIGLLVVYLALHHSQGRLRFRSSS